MRAFGENVIVKFSVDGEEFVSVAADQILVVV